MAEFHVFFDGAPMPTFSLPDAAEGDVSVLTCGEKKVVVKQTSVPCTLYYQMLMFFSNGEGPCYIVSVGDYTAEKISADSMKAGIDTLLKEPESMIMLYPEAVGIKDKELCFSVQRDMLGHCGYKMRNRVAILDVFDGYKDRRDLPADSIVAKGFMNTLSTGVPYETAVELDELTTTGKNFFKRLFLFAIISQPEHRQHEVYIIYVTVRHDVCHYDEHQRGHPKTT